MLQQENEQHIKAGDEHAHDQGNAEEQLQRNGRADDLGQVAGGNGNLGKEPQRIGDRLAVLLAAGLREIAAGGDAEFEREALEQNRQQVRDHDDEEQRVAVAGAGGEIGRPVAGVHVADGDEEAGAEEAEHTQPEEARARDRDRRVDLRHGGTEDGRLGRFLEGGLRHTPAGNLLSVSMPQKLTMVN